MKQSELIALDKRLLIVAATSYISFEYHIGLMIKMQMVILKMMMMMRYVNVS